MVTLATDDALPMLDGSNWLDSSPRVRWAELMRRLRKPGLPASLLLGNSRLSAVRELLGSVVGIIKGSVSGYQCGEEPSYLKLVRRMGSTSHRAGASPYSRPEMS